MLAAFSVSILKNCFALNKEKSLGTKSSKALAEREGFVLDFCSTFRIGFYVTFRKNLRSPFTKQLTGLFCSLRSNPIYILGKAKTERLLASRIALAEREGFVLDFCSTFRIGFYVTFRKNLRSPFTKQLTGLFCSLRSNPIYILGKAKTERLLVSRLALAEREGFEPSCACAQTDFESSGFNPF